MEKRQSHAKPSDMHRVFFTFLTSFGLFLGFGLPGLATAQTEAIHAYPDVTREDALTSSELMEVFSDQTHVGSYNFLYRDIQTYNFMEKTSADGTTRHVQGSRIDTGVWDVKHDRICYDYDDPVLRPACFQIYQRGNCYYHYQVSVMGQSSVGFTARTVIQGETPNCEPSYV